MEHDRLTIYEDVEAYAVARFDAVLIQVWRTATPAFGVERCRGLLTGFGPLQSSLVYIGPGSSPPDQAARAQLAQLGRELARTVAVALVIEDVGLKGLIKRGVMSAVSSLAVRHAPYEIFSATDAAARWLGERGSFDGPDLASVVRALAARQPAVRRPPHALMHGGRTTGN